MGLSLKKLRYNHNRQLNIHNTRVSIAYQKVKSSHRHMNNLQIGNIDGQTNTQHSMPQCSIEIEDQLIKEVLTFTKKSTKI
ncbi:Hypothetical predicted protein [Octopus vulgaris]|uniref:Uncharacterized protein n=1 Tax=Octopus vulgaris TaxID=6645 RepID=A0AA36EZ10_OCTVU|nr:Hypothetical predicted protein [Octopus vulgaris]